MSNDDKRAEVLSIAAGELGNKDPSAYWLDTYGHLPEHAYQWCGVFALWCFRQASLTDWTWIAGRGFLLNHDPDNLHPTLQPEPGDVAYFDKPFGHHALVQRREGDTLYLIQGNYGLPGHVAESTASIAAKHPAFFSIARWVLPYPDVA